MPNDTDTASTVSAALTSEDVEIAALTGIDLDELRRYKALRARGTFSGPAPDRQKLPHIIQR